MLNNLLFDVKKILFLFYNLDLHLYNVKNLIETHAMNEYSFNIRISELGY